MKSIIELRAQADVECNKAEELAFTGRDIDGRFTCTFPDAAIHYFNYGEELRELAFQWEIDNATKVLKVLGRGMRE